jgi:urea transporter
VNAAAIYFDMDEEVLRSGQYARNAVLIGTSVVNSFGFNFPASGNLDSGLPILLFLSVALAPATLLVESIWIQKVPNRIPSLLLPFNIVLLITLFCAKVWNHAMETQIEFKNPTFGMTVEEIELASSSKFLVYEAVLNGLSRIFFVDGNLFTGILILIGVLFCSRIVTATLLAGILVSSFALGYIVFEENHRYLNSGYAGFNPALCAAGVFFYLVPSWKLTGLAVFGIVATLIAQCAVDIVLWNLYV